MFNERAFRRMIEDKNLTLDDVAKALNISKVTLYRKMSGESDFYRREMEAVRNLLHENNMEHIFFA